MHYLYVLHYNQLWLLLHPAIELCPMPEVLFLDRQRKIYQTEQEKKNYDQNPGKMFGKSRGLFFLFCDFNALGSFGCFADILSYFLIDIFSRHNILYL